MASVAELYAGDAFDLVRLRGEPDYGRANVPYGELPNPVAVCVGNRSIVGPSGNIGGSEYWNLSLQVPQDDSIQWVLCGADVAVFANDSALIPLEWIIWPIGDATVSDDVRGPAFGPGDDTQLEFVPAVSRTKAVVAKPSVPRSVWLPLEPSLTQGGFSVQITWKLQAGGCLANTLRVDARGIRLLGYPIQTKNTAELWSPLARRGS